MPFSMAATAAAIALMLVSLSDLNLRNSECSESRRAFAFAIWSFASARLAVCSARAASVAAFFSAISFSLLVSASILASESWMLCSRVVTPVLQ